MLDQGQTLTINAVERDYNLITFDKMKTERIAQLADGQPAKLSIDHSETAAGIQRHLIKSEVGIEDGDLSGYITVSVTVTHPKWANHTTIGHEEAGLVTWVGTNLSRILNMES